LSIVATTLVFAGVPLGFIALMALFVYGRAELNTGTRYRPGRPWEHAPVWYLPHRTGGHAPSAHAELEAGDSGHEPAEAVGGASGEW